MSVFFPMSIAILTWSLYPLAATIGLKSMGGLEMIFFMHLFASMGGLIICIAYLKYKNELKKSVSVQKTLDKNAFITIFISGISGVIAHGSFIFALTLAHKGGVSLLFESWPIIAVIATPLFMKKQWKQVSLQEFLISIVALIGIAIVIFSDDNLDFNLQESIFVKFDFYVLGGYILAFIGAYMSAVVAVTKASYADYLKNMENDFSASIISETLSRVISMIIMSVIAIFVFDDISFTTGNLLPAFYIGLFVLFLGSVFYTLSLLNAETPTVHILYYLVPVLAVLWLWVFGETTINSALLIGGAIVVAANIYLVIAGRKAPLAEAPSQGL